MGTDHYSTAKVQYSTQLTAVLIFRGRCVRQTRRVGQRPPATARRKSHAAPTLPLPARLAA